MTQLEMRKLTIVSEHVNGSAILCERHFKEIQMNIAGARDAGVVVTVESIKRRGCRF